MMKEEKDDEDSSSCNEQEYENQECENSVNVQSTSHSVTSNDIMNSSARKIARQDQNGRRVKIARTDNGNLSDSYDALILEEEEEAVEIPGNRFWTLPITNVEGIKDVSGLFMSIVGDAPIRNMLTDDSSVKKQVWQKVADKMSQLGYPIIHAKDNVEAGLKCNQKWKSLVRMYHSYNRHISSGQKTSRSKPKFYDEIDSILSTMPKTGNRRKSSKRSRASAIEDVGDDVEVSSDTAIPRFQYLDSSDFESPSDSSDSSCNRNRRSKKFSLLDVIELLKQVRREDRRERRKDRKAREEDKKIREKQFNQLMAKLEKENQLKEKMVNLFETFLQNTSHQ